MRAIPKVYLGDSVYVASDGYMLTLTTENGYGPSNTIVLEPEVREALFRYIEGLRQPKEADWSLEPGEEGP